MTTNREFLEALRETVRKWAKDMEDEIMSEMSARFPAEPDAGLSTADRIALAMLGCADLRAQDDSNEYGNLLWIDCLIGDDVFAAIVIYTDAVELEWVSDGDGSTKLSPAVAARCRAKWEELRKEGK